MSVPVEQGYDVLQEVPSMETKDRTIGLNLKATELRLGLPGSESPERENGGGLSMLKSLVSGAKRGFSDAIDGGSGKWVLSGNGGSEMGLCKDGNLFSPKAKGGVGSVPECINQQNPLSVSVVKETVPQSPKPLHDNNKPQISAPAAKYSFLLFYFNYVSLFLYVCLCGASLFCVDVVLCCFFFYFACLLMLGLCFIEIFCFVTI